LKLNGGLGTSMGLSGPKSLIVVKDGKNFLEIIFEQIENINKEFNVSVPLILMNSFNTEVATKEVVERYPNIDIRCFNQNQFPRLDRNTLLPLATSPNDPSYCWYPPGHGDVYDCLEISGVLDKLIAEGREYIFISNVDNLGAVLDLGILTFLLEGPSDKPKMNVVSEQTPKLPCDVKGGVIIKYRRPDGSLCMRLLETAMVPSKYLPEFKSQRNFLNFHINNIWVRLPFLKQALKEEKIELDVIINPKVVSGRSVLQLETACGMIVKCSPPELVTLISVPRSRFIPTKLCSDLFLLQSNYYILNRGILEPNPKRGSAAFPLISLGQNFVKINQMTENCPSIPDLLEVDILTVVGDVSFGANVIIRGQVCALLRKKKKKNVEDKKFVILFFFFFSAGIDLGTSGTKVICSTQLCVGKCLCASTP
jgi:UTP--glucose-1-phosphate uridylyltransferase